MKRLSKTKYNDGTEYTGTEELDYDNTKDLDTKRNNVKKEFLNSPKELLNNNDQIGDTEAIDFDIDYKDRDQAAVLIDGELITGKASTHAILLNEWCAENGIDPMKSTWYRPTKKELKKKLNKNKVAFGHIISNVLFVDTMINYSPDEIISTCNGQFNKIYILNFDDVKRIAEVFKDIKLVTAEANPEYLDDEFDDDFLETPEELANLNDQIGDSTNIGFKVDNGRRDFPFVIIDGNYITDKSCETHTQIVNKWLEDNNIEQFKEKWYRVYPDQIKKKIDINKMAFGSAVDGIALIDHKENYSDNEVADILKNEFNKVYDYVPREYATRIASYDKYIKRTANTLKRILKAENNESNSEPIEDTFELKRLNDNIGDITNISFDMDYGERDYPILIIDDKVLKGKISDTHTEILNRWLDEQGKLTMDEHRMRINPNIIKRDVNCDTVAFAHADNDMAFIDTCSGYSFEEAANLLRNDYDKVYKLIKKKEVERLAKKH